MNNLELLTEIVDQVANANRSKFSDSQSVFNCYLPIFFIYKLQSDIISKYGPLINSFTVSDSDSFRLKSLVLPYNRYLNLIEDNSRIHIEIIKH